MTGLRDDFSEDGWNTLQGCFVLAHKIAAMADGREDDKEIELFRRLIDGRESTIDSESVLAREVMRSCAETEFLVRTASGETEDASASLEARSVLNRWIQERGGDALDAERFLKEAICFAWRVSAASGRKFGTKVSNEEGDRILKLAGAWGIDENTALELAATTLT